MSVEIVDSDDDQIYWDRDEDGSLMIKKSFMFYREKGNTAHWEKRIWNTFLPPSVSIFIWKILRNRLPIAVNLNKRGAIYLALRAH